MVVRPCSVRRGRPSDHHARLVLHRLHTRHSATRAMHLFDPGHEVARQQLGGAHPPSMTSATRPRVASCRAHVVRLGEQSSLHLTRLSHVALRALLARLTECARRGDTRDMRVDRSRRGTQLLDASRTTQLASGLCARACACVAPVQRSSLMRPLAHECYAGLQCTAFERTLAQG
jgi:hypothetical protein